MTAIIPSIHYIDKYNDCIKQNFLNDYAFDINSEYSMFGHHSFDEELFIQYGIQYWQSYNKNNI